MTPTTASPAGAVLVRRPAIVSAYLAPIFFIGGTVVAGLAWPSYDPIAQTISELAAGDAPTRGFMTLMFMLTAISHGVTGAFTPGIGKPGRIALLAASAATFAVALFPLPSVAGTSLEHRTSAIIGFIILAIWPVLGMRLARGYPWIIRPIGAILGTLILGALCFWFLGVWASPSTGYLGLVERVAANAESLWPAIVVTGFIVAGRRSSAGSRRSGTGRSGDGRSGTGRSGRRVAPAAGPRE